MQRKSDDTRGNKISHISAGKDVVITITENKHFYGVRFAGSFLAIFCGVGLVFAFTRSSSEQPSGETLLCRAQSGEELFRLAAMHVGSGRLSCAGEQQTLASLMWAYSYASDDDINSYLNRISSESQNLSISVMGCALWLAKKKGMVETGKQLLAALSRGKPNPSASSLAVRDDGDWARVNGHWITTARAADLAFFRGTEIPPAASDLAEGVCWWDAYAIVSWMGGRLPTDDEMQAYLHVERDFARENIWLLSSANDVSQEPVGPGWIPTLVYDGEKPVSNRIFASNRFPGLRFAVVFDGAISESAQQSSTQLVEE